MKDLDTLWKQKQSEELAKLGIKIEHEAKQQTAKLFIKCNKAYAVYIFVGLAFMLPLAF